MNASQSVGQQVEQLLLARARAMQAHAQTLNIFLQMRISALQGNQELQESIEYIAERLPTCHTGTNNGNRVYSFIVGQTFISLVSEFESFLVDVMCLVAQRYPHKLGSESFRLSEILELQDPEYLVRIAAERFINGIMYKRPSEYRKALADVLSAETDFLSVKWPSYVECKARRDLGVHNGWRINSTYQRKLEEIGYQTPPQEYLVPDGKYFFESVELFVDIGSDIATHCKSKFAQQ